MANHDPIILVHGVFGYGPNEALGFSYWQQAMKAERPAGIAVNAASFLGIVIVVRRWHPVTDHSLPAEHLILYEVYVPRGTWAGWACTTARQSGRSW